MPATMKRGECRRRERVHQLLPGHRCHEHRAGRRQGRESRRTDAGEFPGASGLSDGIIDRRVRDGNDRNVFETRGKREPLGPGIFKKREKMGPSPGRIERVDVRGLIGRIKRPFFNPESGERLRGSVPLASDQNARGRQLDGAFRIREPPEIRKRYCRAGIEQFDIGYPQCVPRVAEVRKIRNEGDRRKGRENGKNHDDFDERESGFERGHENVGKFYFFRSWRMAQDSIQFSEWIMEKSVSGYASEKDFGSLKRLFGFHFTSNAVKIPSFSST